MFPRVPRQHSLFRLRRTQAPYFVSSAEIANHLHENAQNGLRCLVEDLTTALSAAERIVARAKPAERNIAYAASLPNSAPELTTFVEKLSDTAPFSSLQGLRQLLAIDPSPQSRTAVRNTAALAYTGNEIQSSLRFLQEHALNGRPSSNFVDMIRRAYAHARHIGTVDPKTMDVADAIIDATLGMALAGFKKPDSITSNEIDHSNDSSAQSYIELITQFEAHGGLEAFLREYVESVAHGDILRIHDAKLLQAIVEECDLTKPAGREEAARLSDLASKHSHRKIKLALGTYTKLGVERLANAIDNFWPDAAGVSLDSLHQRFEQAIGGAEQQTGFAGHTQPTSGLGLVRA